MSSDFHIIPAVPLWYFGADAFQQGGGCEKLVNYFRGEEGVGVTSDRGSSLSGEGARWGLGDVGPND